MHPPALPLCRGLGFVAWGLMLFTEISERACTAHPKECRRVNPKNPKSYTLNHTPQT
jgi:hypothetical protein